MKEERIKYFYEYAFYKVVDNYNKTLLRLKKDGAKINNDQFIKTSEARGLRAKLQKEFDDKFSKYPKYKELGLAFIPIAEFKNAMKSVFDGRIEGIYEDDTEFNKQLNDFKILTYVVNDEIKGVIPVSPYDIRYSNLENSLEYGPKLMALKDIENIENNKIFVNFDDVEYLNAKNKQNFLQSLFDMGKYIPFKNNNDLTGLARLKKYMNSDDYTKAERWLTDVSEYVDEKYLKNSIAILDELNNLGIEYEVKPGTNKGQLEAKIKGTEVSIRVLDLPENSKYIGSIYNGYGRVYYTTNRYNPDGSGLVQYDPNEQDIRNLINYTLGNELKSEEGDYFIGTPLQGERLVKGNKVKFNTSFTTNNSLTIDYKKYDNFNNRVRITMSKPRITEEDFSFKSEEDAEKFLVEAISEAKSNVFKALNADGMIRHFKENGNFDSFVYSTVPEIKEVQDKYVNLLLGYTNVLQKPSFELDEFEEKVASGEFSTEGANKAVYDTMYEMFSYTGLNSEDMIKAHANDFRNHFVGSYELHNGMRFNAKAIGDFNSIEFSRSKFNKELVNAIKILKLDMGTVYGDENYKNYLEQNLITFYENSAVKMSELNSEFFKDVEKTLIDTLKTSGVKVDTDKIKIDENGIIKYEGLQAEGDLINGSPKFNKVEGFIGQIFEPDELGVVRTKFNGKNNYAFVPGYTAVIVPQKDGEHKSMFERTKLTGYKEALIRAIKSKVRADIVSHNKEFVKDSSIGLNFVYKNLYEDRYSLDFIKEFETQGMSKDIMEAIIKTQAQKVRYSSDIRDNSSVHAEHQANTNVNMILNDNNNNAYTLTGGQNISILEENADGYFDPIATNSTSTNQGAIRYLVEGAKVDENGFMIKSDENDRCTFMKSEIAKNFKYNPFDRQNMTLSNILTAFSVTEPVCVAQMTLNGWTYDDPMVISKKFAEGHKIKDATSKDEVKYRDLIVGDKLSDLHGNKGVISLIVDPDMTDEEAEAKGILKEVKFFRDNPNLDIVMAPFPSVSRYNGGTNRELMSSEAEDITLDGEVIPNAAGYMRIIVTDKAVDEKTHIYDSEDAKQGKGRKVSSQLAWAFNSKGASAILKECYGSNIDSFINLKEYAEICGVFIDDQGEFHIIDQNDGIDRDRPTLSFVSDLKDRQRLTDKLNKDMINKFKDTISESGGYMELPFELKYPTGEYLKAEVSDEKTFAFDPENGMIEQENYVYKLPVLSKFLRSEQSLDDGEFVNHDYSIAYMNIYKSAMMYVLNQNKYNEAVMKNDEKAMATYEQNMKLEKEKAQFNFDEITSKINERVLASKKNIFKEQIMGKRMPNSATAVWTSDPRLGIEEVALGGVVADTLKVNDGEHVLLWRDPILRDSGVRYMKVKVNDDITGAAINPSMDKPFDGDFDGDSVGIIKLNTKAAKKEAFELFSIQNNLLDYGSKDENGNYGLAFGSSLDHKVSSHFNPYIKERFDEMKKFINEFERDYKLGKISKEELDSKREVMVGVINVVLKDSFEKATGKAIIKYDENHLQSVYDSCINTGAKGSPSKFRDYMNWLGYEANIDEENGIVSDVKDTGDTLTKREQHIGTMYATAIKSFGTGIAGAYSQRGMSALRNLAPQAVLELTYPVTQSILQAKHDPIEAKQKYQLIMTTAKALWDGKNIEKAEDGSFYVGSDKVDYISWKEKFYDFYTSKKGLNVDINKDFIDEVAEHLKDDNDNVNSISTMKKEPLDLLAYSRKGFKDLSILQAIDRKNLFEGKYNEMFKPKFVEYNQKVMSGEIDKDLKDLDKSDIKQEVKSNKVNKKQVEDIYKRVLMLPEIKINEMISVNDSLEP